MRDCFLVPTLIISDAQCPRSFRWYLPWELGDNFRFTIMFKALQSTSAVCWKHCCKHTTQCATRCWNISFLLCPQMSKNTWHFTQPNAMSCSSFHGKSHPGQIEEQNKQTSLATAKHSLFYFFFPHLSGSFEGQPAAVAKVATQHKEASLTAEWRSGWFTRNIPEILFAIIHILWHKREVKKSSPYGPRVHTVRIWRLVAKIFINPHTEAEKCFRTALKFDFISNIIT